MVGAQEEIDSVLGISLYLREYAIRFHGAQPLAIGVTPVSYEKIMEEALAEDNGGIHHLKVFGILIVPVA